MADKHISFSELDAYQRCRLKHHYSYKERLTPIRDNDAMSVGSLFHELIAGALFTYINIGYDREFEHMVYEGVDESLDSLLTEGANPDIISEVRIMMHRSLKEIDVISNWRTVIDATESADIPCIEYSISVPILNDLDFVGRVDWIAEDVKTGHVYIIDWKTRRSLTADENASDVVPEDFSMQLPLYTFAVAQQLGIQAIGTITYQINSNPKARIFTRPVTILRSMSEVMERWMIATRWVTEINEGKVDVLPNIGYNCSYCQFKALCLADNRGYDKGWIIANEYEKR